MEDRAALLVSVPDRQFLKIVFCDRDMVWLEKNHGSSLQENSKVILKIFYYNGKLWRHSGKKTQNNPSNNNKNKHQDSAFKKQDCSKKNKACLQNTGMFPCKE